MSDSARASRHRFEQVLAEILQAEEEGREVDYAHYGESYPDLQGFLREFFQNRDGFDRLAACLAATPLPQSSPPVRHAVMSVVPGARLGNYEILGELGRGGMGTVYRARQRKPAREVALKVIRTERLEGLTPEERRQWLERFQREAELVAALDQHPHVVPLYEVGEWEGQPYFTMRLVAGGNLARCLASDTPTDRRQLVAILAEVARAIHFAHQHGILHRDLKPANILLDAAGRPLVSDFGLARRLDQTGSLVVSGIEGTVGYMAPEQASPAGGPLSVAADIYSLGAILYEMLTGQTPFRGKNDLNTLLLASQQDPRPPRRHDPTISRDLETICLTCL